MSDVRVQTTVIGNAGEHLVVGELLKRGVIASQTPRNLKDFDVIAFRGSNALRIRVKTKSARAKGFRWDANKAGGVFGATSDRDVCVLVDLKDDQESPAYYVVMTRDLEIELRRDFEKYVTEPGRGGRRRSPTSTTRVKGDRPEHWAWLTAHKDRWDVILGLLETNR